MPVWLPLMVSQWVGSRSMMRCAAPAAPPDVSYALPPLAIVSKILSRVLFGGATLSFTSFSLSVMLLTLSVKLPRPPRPVTLLTLPIASWTVPRPRPPAVEGADEPPPVNLSIRLFATAQGNQQGMQDNYGPKAQFVNQVCIAGDTPNPWGAGCYSHGMPSLFTALHGEETAPCLQAALVEPKVLPSSVQLLQLPALLLSALTICTAWNDMLHHGEGRVGEGGRKRAHRVGDQ